LNHLVNSIVPYEISAQRRRKHCALAVVRPSQKFSSRRRLFRGRGTAKI